MIIEQNGRMHAQQGNVFVMIFLAIVLIGLLTVALRGFSGGRESISQEQVMIDVAQVSRAAAEIEQGVRYALDNGASETEIRFAPPDGSTYDGGDITTTPKFQVFSKQGGSAAYPSTPNVGSWGFTGSYAVAGIGSSKADLLAFIYNVSSAFCTAMNKAQGIETISTIYSYIAIDSSTFGNSNHAFGDGGTTIPSTKPSPQGCFVEDDSGHETLVYYYVLLPR